MEIHQGWVVELVDGSYIPDEVVDWEFNKVDFKILLHLVHHYQN